jgi:hypothetical protein
MASAAEKRAGNVRLNIYLPNAGLRRLVKTAAAKRDVSISEYCARAITNQLNRDREEAPGKETEVSLASAVENARRSQADTFGGKTFKVSSADLIRQTREQRPA